MEKTPATHRQSAKRQSASLSGQRDSMGRRKFLKRAVPGAWAFSHLTMGDSPAVPPPKRPNIVFVFDDQYRQDVSRFIPTPHAERLSQEGITFRNSLSTTPLCTPYRGMLMTGRYPTHSGIVMNFINASPLQNPDCLGNVFAAAGYDTGFIGKLHLAAAELVAESPFGPYTSARAEYRKTHPNPEFVPPGAGRLGFDFWQAYNFHEDFNNYWYYEDTPEKIYSGKYETDTIIGQTISYIEKHKNGNKPFLVVAAPHPPHTPWRTDHLPEGYLDKIPSARDLFQPPNVPQDHNPVPPEQWRMYLAMAKNFDDNLGRLMDYLDRSGVGQDTILVSTADHGEMGGSHGRGGKMVPYAESTNIPLIMRWPGKIPAGVVSDALYTPMDHLPTLCGLAGIDAPSEADGEDLSKIVRGQARSLRDTVLMGNYSSHWDFFQTGTSFPEWRGVHTDRYTYVKWLAGQEELYDNLEDPFQMRNLAAEASAGITRDELRWRMKELMISAHDDFLNGKQYSDWYDADRNLVRTSLGPVRRS